MCSNYSYNALVSTSGAGAAGRPPSAMPDIPLWKAVLCSSSAPIYFAPQKFDESSFVDGGLLSNNPTMHALTECINLIRSHRADLLVSNSEITHTKAGENEADCTDRAKSVQQKALTRTHVRLVLSLGCSYVSQEDNSWKAIHELDLGSHLNDKKTR